MEIAELKKLQRKEITAEIKKMTAGEKAEASYAACMNALNSPEFKKAETVMLYKAMDNECDPALIAAAAHELGKKVAYPRCFGNELKIFIPENETAFEKGAYGIWEPIVEKSEEILPQSVDLIIVPGVAFSNGLMRLGRGGGYYDRLLPACTNAVKMGFGFSRQMVSKVACEATDSKLDKIVTNN